MRRYLLHFTAGFVAILAAEVGLARLIDPYDYWGGPVIDGLNRYKPSADKHLQTVKLRQLARVKPRTIIAGNSRVAVGFDPESPEWPAELRPVYNLGLPGVGTAGVVNSLISAMDEVRPQRIILAVDFVDFRVSRQSWRTFRELVRPTVAGGLREKAQILLSLDSLVDSLSAIAEQHKAHPAHITPQGYSALDEYKDIVATEGHAALFEQRNQENAERYLAGPKAVAWTDAGGSADWSAIDLLVKECRKRGIALTLVTYPYHADILLEFQDAGLWPAYEDWQRRLARLSVVQGVPIVALGAVSDATTEPVPAKGDTRTQMTWYWEAGHFKAALGRQFIPDITSQSPQRGTTLRPENVDAYLAHNRAALAAYRAAHPEAAARVDNTVEGARRRLHH